MEPIIPIMSIIIFVCFGVGIGTAAGKAPELPFGVGFLLGFFWPVWLGWVIVRDVTIFFFSKEKL